MRTFLSAALAACLAVAAVAPQPALADDASVLKALKKAKGKKPNFDDVVKAALLSEYDTNRDGTIGSLEISTVSCPVWAKINAEVAKAWGGTGVRVIYGFGADYIWVGYAFGIDEAARAEADALAAACGLAL
jgi:hypothetical protein